jgi:hypothetical protein
MAVLLAALPCGAQDLPDPGRRLSSEEIADPDKARIEKKESAKEGRVRNLEACERARMNRQLSCGTPNSPRSRSITCGEAMVFQQQACELETVVRP